MYVHWIKFLSLLDKLDSNNFIYAVSYVYLSLIKCIATKEFDIIEITLHTYRDQGIIVRYTSRATTKE